MESSWYLALTRRPALPLASRDRDTGSPGRRRRHPVREGRARALTPGQRRRARRRLDHFKHGLGDVAMVLVFTGLRWEEAVAVPAENVDLDAQCMTIDRTASESGGRRDLREDMKTRAAIRW
jgi:hypothetical protein